MANKKHAGGRPRKFSEPSKPITVTLPERTLMQLSTLNRDRARAIVRATEQASEAGEASVPPVRVVEVTEDFGMVIVASSRLLGQIPGLHLVEIAPFRHLLTVKTGTSVADLEIALGDLLEVSQSKDARELNLLKELHALLRKLRRTDQVSKAEVLLVRM